MVPGFVKGLLARFADSSKRSSGNAVGLIGRTIGRIKGKFNAKPKLKKIIVAVLIGAVAVITSAMLILMRNPQPAPTRDSDAVAELFRMELPPEELFLGDEPDFLPALIPERERRDAWNADDARPYWTNPGDEEAKVYEDMMSAVVDEIMERLP
jgi:hypothetical protein